MKNIIILILLLVGNCHHSYSQSIQSNSKKFTGSSQFRNNGGTFTYELTANAKATRVKSSPGSVILSPNASQLKITSFSFKGIDASSLGTISLPIIVNANWLDFIDVVVSFEYKGKSFNAISNQPSQPIQNWSSAMKQLKLDCDPTFNYSCIPNANDFKNIQLILNNASIPNGTYSRFAETDKIIDAINEHIIAQNQANQKNNSQSKNSPSSNYSNSNSNSNNSSYQPKSNTEIQKELNKKITDGTNKLVGAISSMVGKNSLSKEEKEAIKEAKHRKVRLAWKEMEKQDLEEFNKKLNEITAKSISGLTEEEIKGYAQQLNDILLSPSQKAYDEYINSTDAFNHQALYIQKIFSEMSYVKIGSISKSKKIVYPGIFWEQNGSSSGTDEVWVEPSFFISYPKFFENAKTIEIVNLDISSYFDYSYLKNVTKVIIKSELTNDIRVYKNLNKIQNLKHLTYSNGNRMSYSSYKSGNRFKNFGELTKLDILVLDVEILGEVQKSIVNLPNLKEFRVNYPTSVSSKLEKQKFKQMKRDFKKYEIAFQKNGKDIKLYIDEK